MEFENCNVHGPDISFYQDADSTPQMVDFGKMRAAGASFVIVRAGQNNWRDPDFAHNWQAAKLAGLPRGSYWFYDSRADPRAQARLWWSLLSEDAGELPHFLDLEEHYGGAWTGWQFWKDLLVEFQNISGLPAGRTGRIGIYSNYYYWVANAPVSLINRDWFARFPFWLAAYVPVGEARVPSPWAECLFWQFGTPAIGEQYGAESLEIDMNYFNGGAQKFKDTFQVGGELPPNGDTMTKMIIRGTVIGSVTRRQTPAGSTFSPSRYLRDGDTIEADRQDVAMPQWLHLTKINDTPVVGDEWASAGTRMQYISWAWVVVEEPAPEPPAPVDVFPPEIGLTIGEETRTYVLKP